MQQPPGDEPPTSRDSSDAASGGGAAGESSTLNSQSGAELSDDSARKPFVVVAGFGLPGRTLVDELRRRKIPFRVIELNATTCQRAGTANLEMITGNAADPGILREAGAERATLVALMVPNDDVVLAAVQHVRAMNPTCTIIARCAFTSTGLEAQRRGADQTLVAEQIVARDLLTLAKTLL